MPKRRCHYDVLGVSRDVDSDDLKKVYRQLALKLHPDKNRDVDPEEAKKAFQDLQQAYEVLSDPQERAWYDAHRDAILQHGEVGENGEVDIGGIDLFPYFSSSCYSGFGDDEDGFYAVYRKVFDTIGEEDQGYSEEKLEYPGFGTRESPDEEFLEFYAFFSAYVTPRSYSWLDHYDTRKAENRRVARLMEKENKKVRDVGKKERNDLVRELVKFIRKRDKRIQAYNKKLEEKIAENAKKTEERRLKHLEERAKMLEEAKNAKSFQMNDMEKELENLENAYDLEEEEEEKNFCIACNKQLRNDKAYKSHLKQAKHLENVKILKEIMAEEDGHDIDISELNLEEEPLKDSQDEDENENESQMEPERKSKKKKKKNKNKGKVILDESEDKDNVEINGENGDSESQDENDIEPERKSKKKQKKNKNKGKVILEGSEDEEDVEINGENGDSESQDENEMEPERKSKKKQKKNKNKTKVVLEDVEINGENGEPEEEETDAKNDLKDEIVEDTEKPEEIVKPVKKSRRAAKNKSKETIKKAQEEPAIENFEKDRYCAVCKNMFPSKNKLFQHLKSTGHSVYISSEQNSKKARNNKKL